MKRNYEEMARKLMSRIEYKTNGSIYKKGAIRFEGEAYLEYNADHSEFWEKINRHERRCSEVAQIIAKYRKDERNPLHFGDLYEVHSTDLEHEGRSIVCVYGGFNGRADPHKWSNYLEAVADLIRDMEERYGHAWLISWRNNCSDCHAVYIAFEDEKKGTTERAMNDWNNRLKSGEKMRVIFDMGYSTKFANLKEIHDKHAKYLDRISDKCFKWNIRGEHFFSVGEMSEEKAVTSLYCWAESVWGKERTTEFGRFAVKERSIINEKCFAEKHLGDKENHFFDSFTSAMLEFAEETKKGKPIRIGTWVTWPSGNNIVWDGKKWVDYYHEREFDPVKWLCRELPWICGKSKKAYDAVVEYVGA